VGEVGAGRFDEQSLGAAAVEEHDSLQLEEDDWINRGPAALSVQLVRPLADETQVNRRLEVAVEGGLGNEILQRDGDGFIEAAGLGAPGMAHSRARQHGRRTGRAWSSAMVFAGQPC
jgi:hypothetical protein